MMHFLRAWLRKCDFRDGNHQKRKDNLCLSDNFMVLLNCKGEIDKLHVCLDLTPVCTFFSFLLSMSLQQ